MERKRKSDDHNNKINGINHLVQGLRPRSYPPPFLMKTFEMVEDALTNSIVSWTPNNTSFTIWDHLRFTTELLHKYFKHSNFSSFVYQLNNYGFKKVSWERYEYGNPWFQAGKKHLLSNIKRRNQTRDYQTAAPRQDGMMEEQLKTLIAEQHDLKVEIDKFNQHQRDIEHHLNMLKQNMEVCEEERNLPSNLLVRHFIKNLRETMIMKRNAVTKKQKLDDSGSKKIPTDQLREDSDLIQPEDNPGSSVGDDENHAFWKKLLKDESENESGREDQAVNHPMVIVNLED